MNKPLYEEDFVRWSEQQARAIREAGHAGTNLSIDWENVAEEIDSLGRSDRRELATRIGTVIEHLLKLQTSPAEAPRRSWMETIQTQRRHIELLLSDSPSLRSEVTSMIGWALPRAREDVSAVLAAWNEKPRSDLGAAQFSAEQVLGNWLPEYRAPDSSATGHRKARRKLGA